jgi:uncharacterized protein (DUF1800 family)
MLRRRPVLFALLLGAAAGTTLRAETADTTSFASKQSPPAVPTPAPDTARDEAVHVLNRITFGPRPGDVEMVEKMGVRAYIEQQLHPEAIDDSAVEGELTKFDLLQMSSSEILQLFNDERKKVLEKAKLAAAAAGTMPADGAATEIAMTSGTAALSTPMLGFAGQPAKDDGVKGGMPAIMAKVNEYRAVAAVGQLEQAKLVRAVDSPRQLQEVLVDFWSNHFNVDMKKGVDMVLKVADDREVIRPHIWGKFRDLLEASAKSPAMLHYLDNATNTVERKMGPIEQRMRAAYIDRMLGNGAAMAMGEDPTDAIPKPKKTGGINENYAREIMELHTLGVDGGYTQKDVQEVARCFTGWTFNRQTSEFMFRPRQHDNGSKFVLGHFIAPGGGMQDGETVLDILSASPATAHHLALEMCERFVSDDPPAALVDRVAGVFSQTGGDLRAVTEAILTSPEFLAPSDYNTKIKSPLEFAVSAVRASGSTLLTQQPPPFDRLVPAVEGAAVIGRARAADRIAKQKRQSLNWHIVELGEPLFACTPPTGYTEVSKSWVSPGALIERLNFAMALTGQKIADVTFQPQTLLAGTDADQPDAVLNKSVDGLLPSGISDATRHVLEQTALPTPGESKTVEPAKLIALIIGSPEFQRK